MYLRDFPDNVIDLINKEMTYRSSGYVNEAGDSGIPSSHLNMDILDVEDFIKKNNVEEISDTLFFIKNGLPSSKGLLSNDIFGITKDERSNIFGYIDLGGWFIHPFIYKIWCRLDSNILEIVHGTSNFSLDENGYIVKDPNGKTGINFLKSNINKIKIKRTGTSRRDERIKFIYDNKDKMFIKKFLVIPAFYRDVNTKNTGGVGVGSLNKYYQTLLISTRSIRETQDYGLSIENSILGRIQETLLNISNCLFGTSKSKDDGIGLAGKFGIVATSVKSKTTDNGTRLVLSAPQLKVESLDDMMSDYEHAGLPLASALVNFYPFILFHVKRFFENQFSGVTKQEYMDTKDNNKLKYAEVRDPFIQFSDDVIKDHIEKFIYGYSNRLDPVTVQVDGNKTMYMVFKGKGVSKKRFKEGDIMGESPLINRRLTWCDVLYMAAYEASYNKYILVTRYPMDSYFNQFPIGVNISTTKYTEPVYVNDRYYNFYPKIREKDIGKNTSDTFMDTLTFSNTYLSIIDGDYDGDQVSVKGVWTKEANDELAKQMKAKSSFINMGGINTKISTNEAIHSLYSMTKILIQDENKLTDPKF